MQYRTRKMIMPGDLNPRGTLFGGQMLKWIDEETAIYAVCQIGSKNIVTKAMSAIDFVQTATVGDIIEIGVDVVRFGTSSITLTCDVRNKSTKSTIVKVDEIVFVLLDENGKPSPHGKTKIVK